MEIILRFLNLLLAALVTGSVFGIWVSFNPMSLSSTSYVEQHQSLVKGFNVLLPVLGGIIIVSSLWLAYLNKTTAKTSSNYEGYFSVCRLDFTYWQTNRQLALRVRYLSQPIVCDAYGISHPAIEVVSVH